jgi:hypothetical protein
MENKIEKRIYENSNNISYRLKIKFEIMNVNMRKTPNKKY